MSIRTQGWWINVAGALALSALLPLIFLQLLVGYRKNEFLYRRILGTFSEQLIAPPFRKAELPSSTLSPSLPIVLAHRLPATKADENPTDCPLANSGLLPHVSYKCIAVVTDPPIKSRDLSYISKPIRDLGALQSLVSLHALLTEALPDGNVTSPLFVHATLQMGEYQVLLVYPAVRLDKAYRFQLRPWFRSTESQGSLLISPLYQDYTSQRTTITVLQRKDPFPPGAFRLGADLQLPPASPTESLYFLNLLVSAAAALVYLRFHALLRSRLTLYLTLSASILALAYSALLFHSLLGEESPPAARNLFLFLSFLPNGSLLIVAATSLRSTPARFKKPFRTFLLLWLVECLFAALDILTPLEFWSSLYGCFALSFFGISAFLSRHQFREPLGYARAYGPANLSTILLIAYMFWGITQFARIVLAPRIQPLWHVLAHLQIFSPLREVLLDPSSSFLLLLYAKTIAIFVTILYVSALDAYRYRQALAETHYIPNLTLAKDGTVLRQNNLPVDYPSLLGSNFLVLFKEADDRADISHVLLHNLPFRSHVCNLAEPFPQRPIRISFLPPSDAGEQRTLQLDPIDESSLLSALNSNILTELRKWLGRLQQADEKREPTSLRLKQAVELELRLLEGATAGLVSSRITTREALKSLRDELYLLKDSCHHLALEEEHIEWEELPLALRFPRGLFLFILSWLRRELEAELSGTERAVCRFRIGRIDELVLAENESYVTISLVLTPQLQEFRGRFMKAQRARVLGLQRTASLSPDASGMSLVIYLLGLYNARIEVERTTFFETRLNFQFRHPHS